MTAKHQIAMKAALEALEEQLKPTFTYPCQVGVCIICRCRDCKDSRSLAALQLLRECGDGWEPIGESKESI